MKLKDALIIAIITTGIISGAITGIVGGAFSIAGISALIHLVAH